MKKIVLIEDNKDVRENTAELLKLENYEVVTAENGILGVEKAIQFKPDIVICDIMMPELDGYGVLELLSKNEETAGVPFIFLTAKVERADMRIGMNLGADDYLTKPFEPNELLDAVTSRLKKNAFLKKEIIKNWEGINTFFEEASHYTNLEGLSRNYNLKKYGKKETIFKEGGNAHAFYFIQSGNVKTYKITESGKEFVTGLWVAGDFIGQLSLLGRSKTYIESAKILEDAEICSIPKGDFTKLLYGNQVVSRKFIDMISNNLIDVQEHLVAMAFSSVRQRAAKALLELCEKGIIQDKIDSGIGIVREDFAGIIGTATETAIRTLSDFKEEGLVAMGSAGKITLLDREALQNIGDFK